MIFFTLLALVTAYSALAWLVDAPSVAHLLAVELWLSFAALCGLAAALMAGRERFAPRQIVSVQRPA